MKKLISTQGLPFGEYYDENIATALKERVNPRLEHLYSLYSGEEIHTHVTFHFDVAGGEVQSIVLDYTIDNPTRERLSNFRDICDMFFNLTGFIVNYDEMVRSITAKQVRDLAKKYINLKNYVSVSLRPESNEGTAD